MSENPLQQIADILKKYPGISEVQCNDGEFVTFKCCDELSLASITACLDEVSPTNDISINNWRVEVHVDSADWIGVWYWLSHNLTPDQLKIESKILKNKFQIELSERLPEMKEMLYPTEGLGTPDLSFVTVDQMAQELQNRNMSFILGWIDDVEHDIVCKLMGDRQKVVDLSKFIRKSVLKK